MKRPGVARISALFAAASGCIFYAAVALIERTAGMEGTPVALFEEAAKTALLAVFLLLLPKTGRWTRIEALCSGLQAIAMFAALESAAYALAFPDSGTAMRLAWSLPLHMGCALLEALSLAALADTAGRKIPRRPLYILAIAAAGASHAALNALASTSSLAAAFSGTFIAMIPLNFTFIVLSIVWLRVMATDALPDERRIHGGKNR